MSVRVSLGEGCVPSRPSEYAGRYFRVYVRVHLLGRASSTRGWGGGGCPPVGLGVNGAGSIFTGGGEPADDATVPMPPFLELPHPPAS